MVVIPVAALRKPSSNIVTIPFFLAKLLKLSREKSGLIINFLVMPIFFLSGALFPLQGLPKAITLIAMGDPLSYGVDGIRYSLTGSSHFGMGFDFLVLSLASAAILAIGAYLFSKIEA